MKNRQPYYIVVRLGESPHCCGIFDVPEFADQQKTIYEQTMKDLGIDVEYEVQVAYFYE